MRVGERQVLGGLGCVAAWSAGAAFCIGLNLLTSQALAQSKKIVVTVGVPGSSMKDQAVKLNPVAFADLPGWQNDDHLAAWKTFVRSCPAVLDLLKSSGPKAPPRALGDICQAALAQTKAGKVTREAARRFFEINFRPRRVEQAVAPGMLTGYYEPLLKASRTADATFQTPIYKRPSDLVNVVAESERGATTAKFTHMRQTEGGLQPYLTRAQIEQGALKGKDLELLYFRDPVDVYFLQVQGSGRIELPDGAKIRITYDGKNGYPYTSIGRELIQAGTFTPDTMSLKALANWLKADRKRAEPVMWKNESYVFFRELSAEDADGPQGALGTALTPGRSLAVDTGYHALGSPIYVSAPSITHASANGEGFNRLMIAQDVGSAIKGPERGDIFFGSGDKAGRVAGVTKHPGAFYVLEPAPAIETAGTAAPSRNQP